MSKDQEKEIPVVTLIEDPFGIRTGEIAQAQNTEEPVQEDMPILDASEEDGELELQQSEEIAPASLEDAANEWKKDLDVAASASEEAPAEDASMESASDESASGEDLDLNELSDDLDFAPAEEQLEQLENLSRVMKEEQAKLEQELVELAGHDAVELSKRLAAEIAEDKELQAQMAKEASEAEQAAAEEEMEEVDPELQAALPSLDVAEIASAIETLLFLSDKPMSIAKLQEHLGPDFPMSAFQEAVTELKDRYQKAHHGIEVVEVAGGLQFRTKPGRAALAKKLAKVQTQKLSGGAMETLAIIAFRQPCLKEDIDKIRGVDSSYFVRGLLDRKLIQITGRSELPGRPMMYSTTTDFLELFGLKDLSQLPSLRELEQMVPSSEMGKSDADEDPRVKEMRRLVGQMKSDTSTQLIYDHREDEQILSDIRSRVNSISTSTPTLDREREAKKAQEALEAARKRGETITPEMEMAAAAAAMGIELPSELPGAPEQPDMLQKAASEELAAKAAQAQSAAENTTPPAPEAGT